MKMRSMKCNNCGASLELDIDNLISYCPFCGNKLMFDVEQIEEIIKEKERTKQIFKQEEEKTKRVQLEKEKEITDISSRTKIIVALIFAWIASIVLLMVLSMKTLDNVNFSPYQLILILDIIGGIAVLIKALKK